MPAMCLAAAMLIAGCSNSGQTAVQSQGEDGLGTKAEGTEAPSGTEDMTNPWEGEAGQGAGGEYGPEGETPGRSCQGESEPEPEPAEEVPTGGTEIETGEEPSDGTEPGTGEEPSGGAQPGTEEVPVVAAAVARPSGAGALKVRGTGLVGEDGQAVQLRGISTHGLSWFPEYVNGELFGEISSDWGANVVRLAMYTAEYGGYCAGGDREKLRKLVTDGVGYASDNDMYVIVDWHILSDGDPNTYKDEAVEFFSTVSAELAGRDNVLYEICNEPNGGTAWSAVKSYALEVIPAIRENDPDAVILVGTPNWCQYVGEAAADPITEYDNIMYTLHFYAGTHRGELRDAMVKALDGGLPIFVSEYGICDASGGGALDTAEADRLVETMDMYGVSYVMWNLSNKAESSSAISSSCGKTWGLSQGDLSDSGKWLLKTLSGVTAGSGEGAGGEHSVTPPESAPEPPEQMPGGVYGGEGIIEWSVDQVNSWEGGDGRYAQYSLTVRNTGGGDVDGWSVEIPMEGEFEVVNSWNGNFEVSGAGLIVTPVDYNASITAGGSVGDIGFIVRER